jgi:hypothetical protein
MHRASGESSAGVWPLAGKESLAKKVCCCPVSLGGRLGVDGQGESWVGMSEARLGCLDVDFRLLHPAAQRFNPHPLLVGHPPHRPMPFTRLRPEPADPPHYPHRLCRWWPKFVHSV